MAEKNFLVHLNLNKNQILNAALQRLATAPAAPEEGQIYWDTTDVTPKIWTGSAWLDLGQVYTHPTYTGAAQPSSATTGANIISQIQLTNGHVTGVTTRALTAADIGASAATHTHAFSQITGLPTMTILANNSGSTGPASAITAGDLMTMMSIAYGTAAQLTTGTDTVQRTWTAKMISDFVNSKLSTYLTVVNLALGTTTGTTQPITNSAGTGFTLPAATTSLAGLMSAADKVKLNGIASNANNYVHPTNNPGAHPFSTTLTSGLKVLSQIVVNNEGHVTSISGRDLTAADIASVMINDAINNGADSTWSSTKIYSEIQSVVAGASTGALIYQGEFNPVTVTPDITVTTPANTIKQGYTYVVSVAGTFVGQAVEAGDMIIAKVNNPGTTASNWQIVNKNIPAIVAASEAVAGIIEIATNAEALAGVDNARAITPLKLKAVLDATVGGYASNFGNGSNTSFTITHGLNTQDVTIQIQKVSDRSVVAMETKAASINTVTIACNVAPTNNEYRVIIKK